MRFRPHQPVQTDINLSAVPTTSRPLSQPLRLPTPAQTIVAAPSMVMLIVSSTTTKTRRKYSIFSTVTALLHSLLLSLATLLARLVSLRKSTLVLFKPLTPTVLLPHTSLRTSSCQSPLPPQVSSIFTTLLLATMLVSTLKPMDMVLFCSLHQP